MKKTMYEKFTDLLKKNNVTAYSVAKAIDISPVVFTEWKKGKAVPKVDKLVKICEHFGVPITYFIE